MSMPNVILDFPYDSSHPTNYRTFSYSGSTLTGVNIYTDSTMATQLFSIAFNYTGSQLTQIVITRTLDSSTLTKTLTYSGSNLSSITRS